MTPGDLARVVNTIKPRIKNDPRVKRPCWPLSSDPHMFDYAGYVEVGTFCLVVSVVRNSALLFTGGNMGWLDTQNLKRIGCR